MFYYLSFLRPPPSAIPTNSKQVAFTPQIANDLRTETYEAHVDIWYCWIQDSLKASNVSNERWTHQPSKKLTAWKGSASAYTPTPIPLPSGHKVGQSWRIALWTVNASGIQTEKPHLIDLLPLSPHSSFGGKVMSVVSSPIEIIAAGKKEGPKQERIVRVYELPDFSRDEGNRDGMAVDPARVIEMVEQTSFDLDKKVWDSGLGLVSWLAGLCFCDEDDVSPGHLRDLRNLLLGSNGFKAVELGTGIGVVALLLAGVLESFPVRLRRQILATDLATATPLITENFAANAHLFPSTSLQAATLDWGEPLSACKPLGEIGNIDLIMMADVTYNRDSFDVLLRTLGELTGGSSRCKRILMGYKERDPAERELWAMATCLGISFERLGDAAGMGGPGVEIWIGCVE